MHKLILKYTTHFCDLLSNLLINLCSLYFFFRVILYLNVHWFNNCLRFFFSLNLCVDNLRINLSLSIIFLFLNLCCLCITIIKYFNIRNLTFYKVLRLLPDHICRSDCLCQCRWYLSLVYCIFIKTAYILCKVHLNLRPSWILFNNCTVRNSFFLFKLCLWINLSILQFQ